MPVERITASFYGTRRGYTLADLVVTLLIMAILAAVAVPKFSDVLHRSRVEAAATRMKADLGLARQHAMATSSVQAVQFSVAGDSYTMPGMGHLDQATRVYSVDLSADPYQVRLLSTALGGDSEIQFDLYGQPDSGGTITVASGNHQRTVNVDPEIGTAAIP